MNASRRDGRDALLVPVQYNSLEELRSDKQRVRSEIRRSFISVREDVKHSFMPDSDTYLNSSSKYLRYIGYALTVWKTARTVSRFVAYFKRR